MPRVTRAQGTLAGAVHIGGKALAPTVDGKLSVKGGEFVVQGHLHADVHTSVKVTVVAED